MDFTLKQALNELSKQLKSPNIMATVPEASDVVIPTPTPILNIVSLPPKSQAKILDCQRAQIREVENMNIDNDKKAKLLGLLGKTLQQKVK